MNIFELLTLIFVLAGGYFCGRFGGERYGVMGWIGGAIIGAAVAVLIYCLFRKLIGARKL